MTIERKVSIGLIQMSCDTGKPENLAKAIEMINTAADKGARIICLQELFNTLYFCYEQNYDFFALAETAGSRLWQSLAHLAAERKIVLIIPYFEKRADGIYHNSAIVIDADGSILGKYRKNHIPDDPGYYEKFYFTPGDTGYRVFKTAFANIGILICWDQWYPEAARITSLKGADILFYPTAIGWEEDEDYKTRQEQQDAWLSIQKSHAIANGVFVCAVNRVGREKLTTFWGSSFIMNPIGSILCKASPDQDEALVQEIDLAAINHYRTRWPFLRDRRIDTYQPVVNRFIDN